MKLHQKDHDKSKVKDIQNIMRSEAAKYDDFKKK